MTPHCGAGKNNATSVVGKKQCKTLQVKNITDVMQVNDTASSAGKSIARDAGKYTASSAVNRY